MMTPRYLYVETSSRVLSFPLMTLGCIEFDDYLKQLETELHLLVFRHSPYHPTLLRCWTLQFKVHLLRLVGYQPV